MGQGKHILQSEPVSIGIYALARTFTVKAYSLWLSWTLRSHSIKAPENNYAKHKNEITIVEEILNHPNPD